MRKITYQVRRAFLNNEPFKLNNTQVTYNKFKGLDYRETCILLHGNLIVIKKNDRIQFSMSGWPSYVTRERLKAAGVIVRQRKGKQYYLHPLNDNLIPIDPTKWYGLDSCTGDIRLLS